MEVTGKIIHVLEARTGTSQKGPWVVQPFVIQYTEGNYTKTMVFEVFGADKLQEMNIQFDKTYTVSFDINATQYNGKWYNNVRAYNVVPAQAANNEAQAPKQEQQYQEQNDERLPF